MVQEISPESRLERLQAPGPRWRSFGRALWPPLASAGVGDCSCSPRSSWFGLWFADAALCYGSPALVGFRVSPVLGSVVPASCGCVGPSRSRERWRGSTETSPSAAPASVRSGKIDLANPDDDHRDAGALGRPHRDASGRPRSERRYRYRLRRPNALPCATPMRCGSCRHSPGGMVGAFRRGAPSASRALPPPSMGCPC